MGTTMSILVKTIKEQEFDALDDALEWIIEQDIASYLVLDGSQTVVEQNFHCEIANMYAVEIVTETFNCTNEDAEQSALESNSFEKENLMSNQFVAGNVTVNDTIKGLATRLGVDPLMAQGFVGVLRAKGVIQEVGKQATTTGKGRSASIFAFPTEITLKLSPDGSIVVQPPKPKKEKKATAPVSTAPVVDAVPVEALTAPVAPIVTPVVAKVEAPTAPVVVEAPVVVSATAPVATAPVVEAVLVEAAA